MIFHNKYSSCYLILITGFKCLIASDWLSVAKICLRAESVPLNTRSLFLSYTSGNFPTTCSFQSEKERSHKHGILPPPGRWMGDTFFALGGIYIGEPCWKRLYGDGCRFIVLRGDHPRFSSLHRSQGKSSCS